MLLLSVTLEMIKHSKRFDCWHGCSSMRKYVHRTKSLGIQSHIHQASNSASTVLISGILLSFYLSENISMWIYTQSLCHAWYYVKVFTLRKLRLRLQTASSVCLLCIDRRAGIQTQMTFTSALIPCSSKHVTQCPRELTSCGIFRQFLLFWVCFLDYIIRGDLTQLRTPHFLGQVYNYYSLSGLRRERNLSKGLTMSLFPIKSSAWQYPENFQDCSLWILYFPSWSWTPDQAMLSHCWGQTAEGLPATLQLWLWTWPGKRNLLPCSLHGLNCGPRPYKIIVFNVICNLEGWLCKSELLCKVIKIK